VGRSDGWLERNEWSAPGWRCRLAGLDRLTRLICKTTHRLRFSAKSIPWAAQSIDQGEDIPALAGGRNFCGQRCLISSAQKTCPAFNCVPALLAYIAGVLNPDNDE
jgi:hypothetical protein